MPKNPDNASVLKETEDFLNLYRYRIIVLSMRLLASHQFGKKALSNKGSQVSYKFYVGELVSESFNSHLQNLGVNPVNEKDINDAASGLFRSNPKVDTSCWEMNIEAKDIRGLHQVAKMFLPNENETSHLGFISKEGLDFDCAF